MRSIHSVLYIRDKFMYYIGGPDGWDGSLGIYFVYQTDTTKEQNIMKTYKHIFPK